MTTVQFSLKFHNTFGFDVYSADRMTVKNLNEVLKAWKISQDQNIPFLVLGEGSNILFLEDFLGIVVINKIKGIHIQEHLDDWRLHVNSGENWHKLVSMSIEKKIFGLENLAFIPGLVGSAPIQNIGAYGVEFKDVCEYVDVLNLRKCRVDRLSNAACNFDYRDSIFKHAYQFGFVIISVGLKLPKKWHAVLNYEGLIDLNSKVSASEVFNTIYHLRKKKLPNLKFFGNVGSFFKNPFVDNAYLEFLLKRYSVVPYYFQSVGKIKLSAGWLIEQCNLKGFRIGDALVHYQQAAILVNTGQAKPKDIIKLAKIIRERVGSNFGIWLEPEVDFVGSKGKCNSLEVIS